VAIAQSSLSGGFSALRALCLAGVVVLCIGTISVTLLFVFEAHQPPADAGRPGVDAEATRNVAEATASPGAIATDSAPAPQTSAVGEPAAEAIEPLTPLLPPRERKRVVAQLRREQVEAETLARTEGPAAMETRLAGTIRKARELMSQARGTPEALTAHYVAYRCLEMVGDGEAAEQEFDAYITNTAAQQGKPAACQRLWRDGHRQKVARAYYLAARRFEAMVAYATTDQDRARAHVGIGSIHAWMSNRALAEPAFRKALLLGPPVSEARQCYYFLVNVEVCNGDYEQALRDAKALLELPTTGADRARDEALLGRVLEKTAGLGRASKHYRAILKRYPQGENRAAKNQLDLLEKEIEDAVLEPDP